MGVITQVAAKQPPYHRTMANGIRDARLRELKFLSMLERRGPASHASASGDSTHTAMVAHLLNEGFLNGVATPVASDDAWDTLNERLISDRQRELYGVLHGQPVLLAINHKGLVRLAELEQQLLSGRDLDSFGIVLNKRHVLKDTTIALTHALETEPVSLAYLDLNGLKRVNELHGHQAGDELLRTYLKTLQALMGDRSEAYRDGGDEVVVIMRATRGEEAQATIRTVLQQLAREPVAGLESLTASAGIVTTTDPSTDAKELLARADAAQRLAKVTSRRTSPRPSVIALEQEVLEVIDPRPLAHSATSTG